MIDTGRYTFAFDVILAGVDQITVAMADALFEAGCDDCTPGNSGGVVTIHFDRQAGSLSEAVGSAIANVEKAGCLVSRIEVEDETAEV